MYLILRCVLPKYIAVELESLFLKSLLQLQH